MSEPYHPFVFDKSSRRFVGRFEQMYQRETVDGFDSWHQDDLSSLNRRIALTVLEQHRYGTILDVGCGKGAFTHLLKRPDNHVVGVDLSPTAIAIAQDRFPAVEFHAMRLEDVGSLGQHFDLVVAVEVLSYVELWRETIADLASLADAIFVALYLPPDPIGFVKSHKDLHDAVAMHARIDTAVDINGEQLLLLAVT